jgi:hypothetical protein
MNEWKNGGGFTVSILKCESVMTEQASKLLGGLCLGIQSIKQEIDTWRGTLVGCLAGAMASFHTTCF